MSTRAKGVKAEKVMLRGDDPSRVRLDTGKGITEQAHKRQCDMNYILRDYAKTGLIKHAHKNQGRYDDVSSIDFQTAQNIVADAKSMFDALPALTRAEFGHDVSRFLEFARDPDNGTRMQELGITAGIDGIDKDGQLIASMQELVTALRPSESGESAASDVDSEPET